MRIVTGLPALFHVSYAGVGPPAVRWYSGGMADWYGVHQAAVTGPMCDSMAGYSTCEDPTGAACPSVLYDPVASAGSDAEACRDAEHMATTRTMP